MQFDQEGVDDSSLVTIIDLEAHFLQNGMSSVGYSKIKNDIDGGDMSVDILVKFDENELINMANEYQLSTLQRKAFVEAIKILPNSKANIKINNINNNSNHNNQDRDKQFIFVSPQEQSILNQINRLQEHLTNYSKQCTTVKNTNKKALLSIINKLENCGKLIKESIDTAINTLTQQVYTLFLQLRYNSFFCVCELLLLLSVYNYTIS